jgi:branched-chain amino acid aminotransferase
MTMLNIKITKTTSPKAKPDESHLGFGKIFSDHMFLMDYDKGIGWHDARIVPYASLPLDPACVVFHYAQEIFEGMKAYRTADGTIQLFRPDCNAKRIQDSADRLCIPQIPVEDYMQAVKALVDVDRDWVPHSPTAPPCISVRSCSPRCGPGRARQQAPTRSASSALPPAPTMPRASTP